jgi:protocatechuate 3,4-dioxygenase alpha subunit
VGPYFALAVPEASPPFRAAVGPRIRIEGILRDGAGDPVPDGLIETWQANREGVFADDGAGRWPTDAQGRFHIDTLKPGPVPGPNDRPQAPHLLVRVLARGVLTRLVTRIYFDDEPSNVADPILEVVPAARRQRLLARRVEPTRYHLDLVLQGPEESVFFDV